MAEKGTTSSGPGQHRELLATVKARFEENMHRHQGLEWEKVRTRLEARPDRLGTALLTEEEYRRLQEFGEFDTKTSSWLQTPPEIRELGGAMFGDYRFGAVWVYHNGAESYYAARGFRCMLRV